MILLGLLILLIGALGFRKFATPTNQARLLYTNWADSFFSWVIMIGGGMAIAGLFALLWSVTG